MPLYDYKCACGYTEEKVVPWKESSLSPPCPVCDGDMQKQFPIPGGKGIQVFEEGFWEHIDINPTYVRSRRHLAELCKEKGLTSHYLENSGIPLKEKR